MLFDAHIHVFPEKLKGRVLPKLSEIAKSPYYRDESIADALQENEKFGVTHALALHIATNPKQQNSVNDFAIASQTDTLLCFGSVHPQNDNKIEEIFRLKEAGIKGIKLHPDYQGFFADDSAMADVYSTCQKLGLVVTLHTGWDPYSPEVVHNPPKAVKNIATSFPNLKLIAAHMGGMGMTDEAKQDIVGLENVYLDTAMASRFMDKSAFEEIVRLHGISKILFATDSPWSRVSDEKALIESANLSSEDKQKIYYQNAFELFSID